MFRFGQGLEFFFKNTGFGVYRYLKIATPLLHLQIALSLFPSFSSFFLSLSLSLSTPPPLSHSLCTSLSHKNPGNKRFSVILARRKWQLKRGLSFPLYSLFFSSFSLSISQFNIFLSLSSLSFFFFPLFSYFCFLSLPLYPSLSYFFPCTLSLSLSLSLSHYYEGNRTRYMYYCIRTG